MALNRDDAANGRVLQLVIYSLLRLPANKNAHLVNVGQVHILYINKINHKCHILFSVDFYKLY